MLEISDRIDKYFKDKEAPIQGEIVKVVNNLRKEGLPISPLSVSLSSCLDMSNTMQNYVLRRLVGYEKGDQKSNIAAAELDIIKGFQADFLLLGEKRLSESVRLIKQDPKGFLFVEDQAKFWSSPGSNER